MEDSEAARNIADIVNIFTEQSGRVLDKSEVNKKRVQEGKLPANCVLMRDGGSSQTEFPVVQKKYGRTLSIYGQLPCEKAMANLMGAHFSYTQIFDKQTDGAYLEKLANVMNEDEADIVFCHLKGPDEPGHDGDPLKKVAAIEKIDKFFFGCLKEKMSAEDILVVTCDHATPCELGLHSDDPVPLLIFGEKFPKDGLPYDEKNAKNGSCPINKAVDIIAYLVEDFDV